MTGSGRSMDGVSGPHAGRPLLTAGAPALAAEAALVCCHGRGATARGVLNLMQPAVRHGVAVLAPDAERGRWYPRRATAPRAENDPWLSSSVDCVAVALESAAEIGVPPERTVIAGFSQGACLAAETAVRHSTRYGGVVVLSGALPGVPDPDRSVFGSLDGTPAFLGCGADDPHVDRAAVEATADVFGGAGAAVTTELYPGLGHAVADEAFEVLRDRLAEIAGE